MLKFPYGNCNFYQIITEHYFYIDRTDLIHQLERAGTQLLFLRPRRFGKSLLLSMLENYYDVARVDEFDPLFGQLAIGNNPTPKHNQYFVMKWDFSVINPQGEAREIQAALYRYINNSIQDFASYYRAQLPETIPIEPEDALISWQSLLRVIRQTPYPLYLLIDEYDNFANELMMGSRKLSHNRYKALLYGEGCLKVLFKAIKAASAGRGLERVFITGVSPVVLSDMTSGYNVAKNIYLNPQFNALCGFLEAEIAEIVQQIVTDCELPAERTVETLNLIRSSYNGYCFSEQLETTVYNPTLALYFLAYFQDTCQYPRQLLDSNLAMDRSKITYISQLPAGESLILAALNEDTPLHITQLADRFGIEDMLTTHKDTTFMVSLLYYFGVLTLNGETELGKLCLKIPNLVIRKLYVEQLLEMILPEVQTREEAYQHAEHFYQTGELQPLCEFIEQHYFKIFDNRDYRWANELTVKTAFLTVLFNDRFYIMDSETTLARHYADLTLLVRPEMRRYPLLDIIMEFKYVSLAAAGLTGAQAQQLTPDQITTLPLIQQKLTEATQQLAHYRQALVAQYGSVLQLRSYCVVALGFERLVWFLVDDYE